MVHRHLAVNRSAHRYLVFLIVVDEVYIRKSPSYFKQQNVMVGGEVLFSGNYALSKKNERLSDLIAKAGGVTPDAYVKGAILIRKDPVTTSRRQSDGNCLTIQFLHLSASP